MKEIQIKRNQEIKKYGYKKQGNGDKVTKYSK